MPSLELVPPDHPALRQVARPLSPGEVRSARVQELIGSMIETMRAGRGVGLAAPQVGEAVRLIVMEDTPEYTSELDPAILAERERMPFPLRVLINPEVTRLGNASAAFFEGCLSVPGMLGLVVRARDVKVAALDENGQTVEPFVASGWMARVVQHEVDHLDGILYTARAVAGSVMSQEKYDSTCKGRPIAEVRVAFGIAQ